MALSKSTITGRVPLPTDENLQFAELTFALSGLDTEGASVLPGGISTRAVLVGSDIPAGFELWQNTAGLRGTHYRVLARWTVKDRDGVRDKYADLGIIQVGSDPSYTLADLINSGVPQAVGTFWSAITQAQYDAVIQAASDAAASATAAALYDGPRFDTVAALIADTVLSYTAGPGKTVVAVGSYVTTRAEGFAYQVAASGASDQNITTAGGIKLYVVAQDGEISLASANVPVGGVTNVSTQINAVINAMDEDVTGGGLTYYLTGQVTIPSGIEFSNMTLNAMTAGAGTLLLETGSSGTRLTDLSATASDGNILGISNSNFTDLMITGWDVETERYPVLINDTTPTGSTARGMIITNSFLNSTKTDALEYNTYRGNAGDFVANALVLNAGVTGVSISAGFAIGIAGTNHSVTNAVVVRESRQDAIHIEDRQRGTVVSAVSGHDLRDHGVNLLAGGVSSPAISDMDGAVLSALHLTHNGTKTGFYGIQSAFDADGALPHNAIGTSYFKGFDIGVFLGGTTSTSPLPFIAQHIDGVMVDDCNIALRTYAGTIHIGEIAARGTPSMVQVGSASRIGRVISTTPPTTVAVATSGYAADVGGTISGLIFPVVISHTTGTVDHVLFALPKMILGRIAIMMRGSNRFFYTADIKWDGTTLTVTNNMKRELGAAGTISILATGGNLMLRLASTTASAYSALVEINGTIYVEP